MSFPYSGSEKAEQLFPVGTQNTRIHHVHMYTCPQLAAWMSRVKTHSHELRQHQQHHSISHLWPRAVVFPSSTHGADYNFTRLQ